MANDFVSVSQLQIEVEVLLRDYPELVEDEVARRDMLEGETDFREILIRLGQSLGKLSELQLGLGARIDGLNARLSRFNARDEMVRRLIFKVLEIANLKKIELPEVTFSLRNNPPRLTGERDPATLPDGLCKITRTASRTKIREAIEGGQHVDGYELSNAAPSLIVRVK